MIYNYSYICCPPKGLQRNTAYIIDNTDLLLSPVIYIYIYIFGRQHRNDIDLYLKPFRGNNNIINLYTSYEKNVQLSSNKYLLLLLLLYIYNVLL